eukprot:1734002-Rhodomonas_salina.3
MQFGSTVTPCKVVWYSWSSTQSVPIWYTLGTQNNGKKPVTLAPLQQRQTLRSCSSFPPRPSGH